MRVVLTWPDGSQSTIESVEAIRLVGLTTVEIKTFGNDPAMSRGIVAFTVFFGETR